MKRIFMIIFILLIMISFFYLKIKDKNIEVSEEIINNSEKEVNQIEKFAEYNCIVENNKEKILSWKIGLIKNNNKVLISHADYSIWSKKIAKYSLEVESDISKTTIDSKSVAIIAKGENNDIYKLEGKFKHQGKFSEYKGKLFFNGNYFEKEDNSKENIIKKIRIVCIPSEL